MISLLRRNLGVVVIIIGLFIANLFTGQTLFAESYIPESVQIHGFLSQAYIVTNANNFLGGSEGNGSFDFREIGVNASWRALPNLQLSAQLLSRFAGKGDDGQIRMDYGFLDYSFYSDANSLFGIRIGRTMNPFGLYNDTRDVAFTRPSIFLPQSIYFDRTRNFALSADGAQFYAEQRTDIGDFFFQAGIFNPRVGDPELERAIFQGSVPGRLEPDTSWMARLIYERPINDGKQLRLALTGSDVRIDYSPGEMDPIPATPFRFQPWIFSIQYNAENWSVTGEYAWRRTQVKNLNVDFIGESFYLQGSYQFAPDVEGVIRYDVLYADRDDRNGNEFAAAAPGRTDHSRFAKDWTIGLRWDVTSSFMLRTEFHHINGTGFLTASDNIGRDTEQYWNLFSILGSYRF